ncbi:homoserine dehydrogenase [Pelagicoccus sp. SDUM812003]|uniref:homoserine dehydrogenase n=1 Tax=Pelagicoccus sp. SDUM812003 TaxID=3041267 RepID=UPI00280E49FB|nr:homoserine dehydrogenase [Pelagicoccus sp. SDUM812003]MDQ8204458.1 homoserine dehydrogenase [Pelagicoccus sp. SDUM812003]
MSERVIKVGLCGFGVVGQGVFNYLRSRQDLLSDRIGARLEVSRIAVRDTKKKRDFDYDESMLTTDPLSIATDPEVDVVCELMGGTGVALDVSIAALEAGKILVTANKALLCDHGEAVFAAAKRGGGQLFFEASVAGGIPVIKALKDSLVVNRFSSIYGILNGTSNYILTRMTNEGATYQEILTEAKALGYAEADESLDVDGIDAAHKAVVLAYLAHGRWVPFKDLLVEGVSEVTQDDIQFAKDNGYAVKLLAVIDVAHASGKLYISILPTLVSKKTSLGSVDGVFNAVSIHGDVVGETVYIGPGAGRDATASSVIADIVDGAKLLVNGGAETFVDPAPRGGDAIELAEPEEIESRYYVRLQVLDKPGVMAEVASLLASHKVSLASVTQKEVGEGAESATLIVTTHMTNEKAILDSVKSLAESPSVTAKPFCMPISGIEK